MQFVGRIVWEVNNCMEMKGSMTGSKYFQPRPISFHKYNTNGGSAIPIKGHLPYVLPLAVTSGYLRLQCLKTRSLLEEFNETDTTDGIWL